MLSSASNSNSSSIFVKPAFSVSLFTRLNNLKPLKQLLNNTHNRYENNNNNNNNNNATSTNSFQVIPAVEIRAGSKINSNTSTSNTKKNQANIAVKMNQLLFTLEQEQSCSSATLIDNEEKPFAFLRTKSNDNNNFTSSTNSKPKTNKKIDNESDSNWSSEEENHNNRSSCNESEVEEESKQLITSNKAITRKKKQHKKKMNSKSCTSSRSRVAYSSTNKFNQQRKKKPNENTSAKYNCPCCNVLLHSHEGIQQHLTEFHCLLQCFTCFQLYDSNQPALFAAHLNDHRGQRYEYRCNFCGYGSNNCNRYHNHLKIHKQTILERSERLLNSNNNNRRYQRVVIESSRFNSESASSSSNTNDAGNEYCNNDLSRMEDGADSNPFAFLLQSHNRSSNYNQLLCNEQSSINNKRSSVSSQTKRQKQGITSINHVRHNDNAIMIENASGEATIADQNKRDSGETNPFFFLHKNKSIDCTIISA